MVKHVFYSVLYGIARLECSNLGETYCLIKSFIRKVENVVYALVVMLVPNLWLLTAEGNMRHQEVVSVIPTRINNNYYRY